MKKEYKILVLILILAYILRILPYLLGYPTPITDDSLRDFEQVKYIIENKSINFDNHYGAFPILHIIIFLISFTGISPLKIFLFIPQIFPVIGIFFFYLFLRKYFEKKQCLLASFFIAVFSMHIYWSSQPVREALGLFFFPLIIYLFDKEIEKGSLLKKSLLFVSFVLIIMSHNWSTLMTLFFLFFYSIFFIKEKRTYALFLIGIFTTLTLLYWKIVFDFAFEIIFNLLKSPASLLLIPFLLLIFLIKKSGFNKIKTLNYVFLTIIILFIITFIFIKTTIFNYPIQVFINPLLILLLVIIGFFSTIDDNLNKMSKIAFFYVILTIMLAVYYHLLKIKMLFPTFDPLRTLEFLIFPLSILAATGLIIIFKKINKKYFFSIIIAILIISGTFIYPSIFIYKTNFENTIFYDIRSDIRYIPEEGFELIEWANNNNYNVISNNYVINEYQSIFYTEQEKKLILISEQDYRIKQNYEKIKDEKFGIPNPEYLINKTANLTIVYSNEWGNLYKEKESDKTSN